MPRNLIFILLVPLILFSLLLLAVVEPDGPGPVEYLGIGLLLGTMFAHPTLAAAWVALGPLPLLWRLPASLAWLCGLAMAFAINFSHGGGPDDAVVLLTVLLTVQWLIVQVPLWGLNVWYGLQLRHFTETDAPQPHDRQFGIRQVMILTFIVAVFLAVARIVVANLANQFKAETFIKPDALIIVYLGVAGVVVTLPLVLATVIPRYALLATPIVLVLIGLGTWWQLPLMLRAGAGAGPNLWHVIAINAVTAGWIILVMGLLRLGGYCVSVPETDERTFSQNLPIR